MTSINSDIENIVGKSESSSTVISELTINLADHIAKQRVTLDCPF